MEPIVVIAISEKDFFRPQWKWMGGFLVPSGHLYLTSQVHSRELDKESWVEILSYTGSQERILGFFFFLFFFFIRMG